MSKYWSLLCHSTNRFMREFEISSFFITAKALERTGIDFADELADEWKIISFPRGNMVDVGQTEKDIKKIEEIFNTFELKGSKVQILESLAEFEHQTSEQMAVPHLSVIIKWYKNLFLQKASYFPRAEQLLDEALEFLENRHEPIFQRWKLKTYLSLGYVHQAQWNYFDAESYLKDALELALSETSLSKFFGEIYSLLSTVNLSLGRYNQARKYVALEKEKSHETFTANPSDDSFSNIYAFALVNYSRINRLIHLMDQDVKDYLVEAVRIFNRLGNEKGLLLARLEQAEYDYFTNKVDSALDAALNLSDVFEKREMHKEQLQVGLLSAKIYRKILDYEQAENKLNVLFALAKKLQLKNDALIADAIYEMGEVYYDIDEETKAIACFRESAKAGMVLGIKNIIARAFKAVRSIDRHKAKELLGTDLVYADAMLVRNRIGRTISPFKESRAKVKLFASTLFVDIIDFSKMMKRSEEDLTVKMINELIDRMSLIIYQHNGYIDKFLGDGFMAIFEHGYELEPDTAFDAVKSGMDIHRALNHKNKRLRRIFGADKDISVRIGISTGEIYAMLLGNYIKTEFTYFGNSVNLASRLESLATNQFMLIDEQTHTIVKDKILSDPEQISIRGIGETTVYKVLRLARMHERSHPEKTSPI